MEAKIYQIFFDAYSRSKIDPRFIGYDNSDSTLPQEREIYVFKHGYPKHLPAAGKHVGFVSWKFHEKSHLTGEEVHAFLARQQAVDVLLVNPFPHLAVGYRNPWHQAEAHHPLLGDLARKIFAGAGIEPTFLGDVFDSEIVCYCNYFTATSTFWEGYLAWIARLEASIASLLPDDRARFEQRADQAIDANHYSFFFERCLSTYLHLHPELRCVAFPPETIMARQVKPQRMPEFSAAFANRRNVDRASSQAERRTLFDAMPRVGRDRNRLSSACFAATYRLKNFVKHHLLS